MSSLGDLYFALGLDDKEFNNALDAAKKRVAELGADISINFNIDASKVANEVQRELNALSNKKIETGVGVKKEDLDKLKNLTASIAEAEKELSNLESAKFKNTSAIERAKGYLEMLRKQYDELIKVQNLATKGQEAISEASASEQTVQHVVAPEAIAEVKALTEAMNGLNTQMEVSNRLRELSLNKKKGKTRTDLEKEAKWASEIRDEYQKEGRGGTTAEYESIEYIRAQNLLKKQYEEQQAIAKELERIEKEEKKLEEKAKLAQKAKKARNEAISKQLTSEMLSSVNSIGQQSPEIKALNSYYRQLEKSSSSEAKSSNSKLKEQLLQLQRLEQAIKKLQYMRVDLDTSGIDEDSLAYKRAAMLLDDYIKKLQEMQSSGKTLSKNKVDDVLGVDFSRTISDVNHSVSEELRAQKRIAEETRRAAREEERRVKLVDKLKKGLKTSSDWASQLNNQLTNAFSIYSIERFIRSLYTVGGEFQKQQIALRTMIGDAVKGDVVFERMKDMAVKSPFTFSELASYTKQMSAYGIEYEELYDTTKRLADISAGVGVDMGRLILAYGQVRSAEVLRGQELRQFTEAGIPLVAELAKRLSEVRGEAVEVGEVFEAISKRQVSFGMVKDVLFDMTDPGGKFFEMQEELAKSLAGQWSNMKDAWDIMIADIANGTNNILSGAAGLANDVLRNWREWIPVLSAVAGGIGVVTGAIRALTMVTTLWNTVTNANPWMRLASIALTAVGAISGWIIGSKTATKNTAQLNDELDEEIQKWNENRTNALRYIDTLKSANTSEERRILLYNELLELYPDIFKNMKMEEMMLKNIADVKTDVNEATTKKQIDAINERIKDEQAKIDDINEARKRTNARGSTTYRALTEEERLTKARAQAEIERLEQRKRDLQKEINREGLIDALTPDSDISKYIEVYRELGKAVKIIRQGGILGELANPKEGMTTLEYYEQLNNALKEQNEIKEKFKPNTDEYKDADKLAKVYQSAIDAIGGIWGAKDFEKARKEAERKAKEQAKRDLDAYIDALKERIKEISSKWSLFKELMDVTGNRQMALNLSELGNVGFKNELEHLRSEMTKELSDLNINISAGDVLNMSMDELNKVIGDKDKLKRIQAIYDAYHNANRSLRTETIKDFAEIIKASRDFEAKIAEIERKLQEDLSKLREVSKKAGLSTDTEEYKRAEAQLRKDAEKKKTEVRFEEFKESSNWVKVFDDLDRVSNATLDDMIAKIEAFAGSTEISQKELKELVEALSKLRKESIERNPFGGLANSISRLKELQLAQQRGLNQNGKYMVRDSTGFHREMEASDLSNAIKAAEADLVASINGISGAFKDLEGIVDPLIKVLDSFGEGADDLVMGFSILSDILSTASSTSNSFSNLMGLSVGKDDKGNAISLADKLGIKNAGLWGAVAGAALGAISSIAGAHDKKLDKAIEKSKQKVKELENAYKNIEDAISTQLGEATRSQTESMVKNLEQQRSELYKQLEAEEDKKKTDNSKVSDYKQQIHKVEREMALFYKNLASEQYGIDLKGWSSQIAKSLTDAFAKGEDAAIAFKRTTSEILSSLVTEMINLNVIQKALKGVEDYLFGANGIATNNSEGGAKITKNEAIGLSNKMQEVEGSLTEAKYIWDALNEATGGALETVEDVAKGGLTKDIQGVTEDTANLLGSYLNAIRQSVHVKQQLLEQLVGSDVPKMNYLAEAQLQQLQMVVANTKRNADTADKIYSLIDRVVDKGGNRLKI